VFHLTLTLTVLKTILPPDDCGCSFSCIAEKFSAIAARPGTDVLILMCLTLLLKQF
jgi:hypothetical protein